VSVRRCPKDGPTPAAAESHIACVKIVNLSDMAGTSVPALQFSTYASGQEYRQRERR
jgi:hypothetical protein